MWYFVVVFGCYFSNYSWPTLLQYVVSKLSAVALHRYYIKSSDIFIIFSEKFLFQFSVLDRLVLISFQFYFSVI